MSIIGYTFNAENYTEAGLIAELVQSGIRSPGALGMSVESVLDQWAGEEGIDRDDEWTFDSGNFPKVIEDNLTGESFRDENGHYVDAHGNEVD